LTFAGTVLFAPEVLGASVTALSLTTAAVGPCKQLRGLGAGHRVGLPAGARQWRLVALSAPVSTSRLGSVTAGPVAADRDADDPNADGGAVTHQGSATIFMSVVKAGGVDPTAQATGNTTSHPP